MLHIGTSGYSYDDWIGPFYPKGTTKGRFLEHYARHFDTVEINATYYAPASVRMMEGLVRRSGGLVTFCVKANRRMTHERDADAPAYDGFREAIEPLVGAGVLGAVLAQFPQSLKPDARGREAVERVREGLGGLPLVFEFRHRSWVDARVFSWMRSHEVGLCCVDGPAIESLFPPLVEVTSPSLAYLRCHGRNAEAWYEHEEAYQRYDYLYSDEETREVAAAVRKLESAAGHVFVFYNNHFRAKSVDGARRLMRALEP